MTKKIKILMAFIAMLIFACALSCNKILNANPSHQIDGSNSFKTIDDYNAALTGAYHLFQQSTYYGTTPNAAGTSSNAYVCFPDMLSDNLNETSESLNNYSTETSWQYAADDANISATWVGAYAIIAQANIVLRGIDDLKNTDQLAINRVKGQALAIRAMVHFDILRYWAEDYDRNSDKPGIPYISSFDYNVKPPRGTVKETYDNIEADLRQAKQLLSNTDIDINSDGRAYMDSSVVNAIFARMYLYSNQLDSAIKYSTYVINAFPLASRSDFPNIWTDASNSEVIWYLAFNSGEDNIGGNVYFVPNDRSSYKPNPTLISTYDKTNDIRYTSYFKNINGRLVVSKYLAKQAQLSNPDGIVNFKAFRTGEMYLIRAEAYARLGNDALGLADLNTLRSSRIAGFTAGTETGNALINVIALERRKELICEGHRWFDLKRTSKTINRTQCADFCTLTPDDRAWAWPIPIDEINANSNILPQNDGY